MLPRKNFVFRGCLLLSGIVFSVGLLFFVVIWGEPAEILNRVGMLLEMIGIVSILPDLIGEKRLQKAANNVRNLRKMQHHLKYYLYTTNDDIPENIPGIVALIMILGNVIMSLLFVFSWVGVFYIAPSQYDWIYIGMILAFSSMGILAASWLLLFFYSLFSLIFLKRTPKLFEFFITIDAPISAMGILISSALAYGLVRIIPLLISIARVPIRKTIATITIPFILLGALLQFCGTYL